MSRTKITCLIFILNAFFYNISAEIFPLSGEGWKASLDSAALWESDTLFLPEQLPQLNSLPVNAPSFGWDALYSGGKPCVLPASVEELFGTSNSWTYHGVSWFYRSIRVPSTWEGQHCFLTVGQYRQRIEIYVNEQLAGYDVVGMVPYKCDITNYLRHGKDNRIAFRITNPGGNRGWEDFQKLMWGNFELISDKDFSGIGGDVFLEISSKVHVDDVFVKNQLPSGLNNISIQVTTQNLQQETVCGKLDIEIVQPQTNQVVCRKVEHACFYKGENKHILSMSIPDAESWSFEKPVLYECRVRITDENMNKYSEYSQNFGFRVFEVRDVTGKNNFYINGKRIRLKSAIDWGIYAFTGLYPTAEVAKRSIQSVKDVGHNSLNCHRRMGDAILLNYADSLGVGIYEEPGGFHSGGQIRTIDTCEFVRNQMYERIRRMVIRDRNHPSVLIYTLANEDNVWSLPREHAMRLIQQLDDSRLIVNSSGGNGGGYMDGTHHLRPYEKEIRTDYCDHHTVYAGVYFNDMDLNLTFNERTHENKNHIDHYTESDSTIVYWGEVRCFPGVFNTNLIYHQNKGEGGYDLNLYRSQALKIDDIFKRATNLGSNHMVVKFAKDLTKQAARGQMYTNGRLGQRILASSAVDGYAINGWSPGPDMPDDWSSAITDLNRNINGPADDMAYWNRPLQIAIFRIKGKYFEIDQEAIFQVSLINENKLPKGNYNLKLLIKDGRGRDTGYRRNIKVDVLGGDIFAQTIVDSLKIKMDKNWMPGYITIEASLTKENMEVANGAEQVLYRNRALAGNACKKGLYVVCGWPEALKALKEANLKVTNEMHSKTTILLGKYAAEKEWEEALEAVNQGANILLQMDSTAADRLYKFNILNVPVNNWGGIQSGYWRGNGAAYIGDFLGRQSLPSHGIVSTRSWEVESEPRGFWPFESDHELSVYGMYFAHTQSSDKRFVEDNNTLVMIGGIKYGKGFILLSSAYFVDQNSAFNDLLFYGMLEKLSRNE